MSLFVGVNICLWYVPWILLFNTDTSHWTFICSVNCERMRTGVMPSPNSPYHINVHLLTCFECQVAQTLGNWQIKPFSRTIKQITVKTRSHLYCVALKWLFLNLVRAWWCHQMETFSALLALCAGNSPVPGEYPAQRPVTRNFDVYFELRLNKRLSKQS